MIVLDDKEVFKDWGRISDIDKSDDDKLKTSWHNARHYHVQECMYHPELHVMKKIETKTGFRYECSCGFAGELDK